MVSAKPTWGNKNTTNRNTNRMCTSNNENQHVIGRPTRARVKMNFE
jgi:hypothetical protein